MHVKRNSLSDSQPLYKAMAFFALFLLIGNASNFIGQSTPILLAVFIPESDDKNVDFAINYILGVFVISDSYSALHYYVFQAGQEVFYFLLYKMLLKKAKNVF